MNIPEHISIIMDGNGRWAKARGLERVEGHKAGVGSVRTVTEACAELGVRYLSLYTFSEENWNRPKEEVSALMGLMIKAISANRDLFSKGHVRFLALGNRERLSAAVDMAIMALEKETASNDGLTLILMLSYSGKWDLKQAFEKLAAQGKKDISFEDIDGALVTAGIPDPELVIRTSGEKRISNYMLWQTAYSEFVFDNTLWPDFGKEELLACIEEYNSRDRRFGMVK